MGGIKTYLVTISPRVVLDTDVLIRVFHTLLERGHVLPVLPVLFPEVVGVDASENQAGHNSTDIFIST